MRKPSTALAELGLVAICITTLKGMVAMAVPILASSATCNGMTDGSGNDLGVDALSVEDLADFGNKVESVFTDVVHTANEGSNIGSACVSGKNSLAGGENNGVADGDALGKKGS